MNRLILRSLVAALLLLVLLSVPSIASADSILWTLTNVAFTPIAGTSGVAGTATGSFDFDATMGPMGTFSNIDIKTFITTPTGQTLLNTYTTLSGGGFTDSPTSLFLGKASGDLSGSPLLVLFFGACSPPSPNCGTFLANAGGLTVGLTTDGGEGSCDPTSTDCSSSTEVRSISAGGTVTSTSTVATPEPTALSLLGAALAALLAGVAIRKASLA